MKPGKELAINKAPQKLCQYEFCVSFQYKGEKKNVKGRNLFFLPSFISTSKD